MEIPPKRCSTNIWELDNGVKTIPGLWAKGPCAIREVGFGVNNEEP